MVFAEVQAQKYLNILYWKPMVEICIEINEYETFATQMSRLFLCYSCWPYSLDGPLHNKETIKTQARPEWRD